MIQKHSTTYAHVAFDIIVIAIENGHGNWVQSLDKVVCISHRSNSLRKGMNSTIFTAAIDK